MLCAEKPLIAKVAAGLSARANNKPIIDKKGIVTPIHEVDGIFNNEALYVHQLQVMSNDFAPGYKWVCTSISFIYSTFN